MVLIDDLQSLALLLRIRLRLVVVTTVDIDKHQSIASLIRLNITYLGNIIKMPAAATAAKFQILVMLNLVMINLSFLVLARLCTAYCWAQLFEARPSNQISGN